MRKKRAAGAALVAAGVVLSGCGAVDVEEVATTTTPVDSEAPVNPWSLPLEERPPLFDPCAEVPKEVIEESVGAAVRPAENLHAHRQDELYACTWKSDEVSIMIVGTWMSQHELKADSSLTQLVSMPVLEGRSSFQASDQADSVDGTCYRLFFTSRGTAVINLNLITALGNFEGKPYSNACEVLSQTIEPLLDFVPEGDF